MRIVKQLTKNKFLNLKEVNDEDMGCKNYQFAERRGVDSVAFICYNEDSDKFLLNNEVTPPIGKFLVRAFGGSIDKDIELIDIVKEEVSEECGYKVDHSKIQYVGKAFVSTQMNQYCHLYMVLISDAEKGKRKPENKSEALSHPVWVSIEDIMNGDDWKSITILCKSKFI